MQHEGTQGTQPEQGGPATSSERPRSGTPGGTAHREVLHAGQSVGRFTILGQIGQGGMGQVYAAYDAQLDRKVAIKIIDSIGQGPALEEARLRLTQEARALARLSHRNVVSIHEAGESEGRLFLAMEHLEGASMRAWLDARGGRVPWQIALETMTEAGHGLAAAHGAKVFHRDFKPANVLIADDGRVVVLDFGVARFGGGQLAVAAEAEAGVAPTPGSDDERLTQHGRVVGTPAYMAPEQLDGADIDARADQFSFCVSLYEAVVGQRPFEGRHALELREAMRAGQATTPIDQVDAPAWLRAAIRRGLAQAPDDRFASMEDLLAALEAPASRMRASLQWAVPLTIGAAVAVALTVGQGGSEPDAPPTCDDASRRAASVWNADAQAGIDAAFATTSLPMAATSAERVSGQLEAWSLEWGRVGDDACRATRVEKRQSEAALHATSACLEVQLTAFEQTVATLRAPDDAVVERADRIASSLPDPKRCRDAEALARQASLAQGVDPTVVSGVDGSLAASRVAIEAAQLEPALAKARAALTQASEAKWDAGRARATFQVAVATDQLGRFEEARDLAIEALALARSSGDEGTAARTLVQLVHLSGARMSKYDEASRWASVAVASAEATGEELLVARAAHVQGVLEDRRAHPEAALVAHARALEIRERVLGPDHLDTVESLSARGSALDIAGRIEEAIAAFELAAERSTRAVGKAHPDTILVLNSLGASLMKRGDGARALAIYEDLIEHGKATWGPEHPNTASLLYGLGQAYVETGQRIAGRELHARALTIREKVLGEEHFQTGASVVAVANTYLAPHELEASLPMWERALKIMGSLEDAGELPAVIELNYGITFQDLGRMEEAEAHMLAARAVWVGLHGEDHLRIADADTSIGALEYDTGRYAEAVTRLERALAIMARAYGPDAAALAYPLLDLARARRESGDLKGARRDLERVVKLRSVPGAPTVEVTITQFELGRTMWRQGERKAAREKVRAARDQLQADTQAGARDRVEEMNAWLAAHR